MKNLAVIVEYSIHAQNKNGTYQEEIVTKDFCRPKTDYLDDMYCLQMESDAIPYNQ